MNRALFSDYIVLTSLIPLWVDAKREVDTQIIWDIITFTHTTLLDGRDHHGEALAQRSQTRQSASARHPQPPPTERDRRVVRARRVLRCARLSTSQVRDASSGAERRPSCFHNRRRVLASLALRITKLSRLSNKLVWPGSYHGNGAPRQLTNSRGNPRVLQQARQQNASLRTTH